MERDRKQCKDTGPFSKVTRAYQAPCGQRTAPHHVGQAGRRLHCPPSSHHHHRIVAGSLATKIRKAATWSTARNPVAANFTKPLHLQPPAPSTPHTAHRTSRAAHRTRRSHRTQHAQHTAHSTQHTARITNERGHSTYAVAASRSARARRKACPRLPLGARWP